MASRNSDRAKSPQERQHVALIVETSINYGRGVLRGITRYMRENTSWSVFLEQRELGAELPAWIQRWNGDGIVTRNDDPRILRSRLPTVGLFDHPNDKLKTPIVLNDNVATGRMALKHLIDRGLKHFAYFGVPGTRFSQQRFAGALEACIAAGYAIADFQADGLKTKKNVSWEQQQDELAEWLKLQPKPLGLFCANDICGQRALDSCRRAGLVVPEQVAVIAVDNDIELCELADPPLTSIATNPERVGYEAACLLNSLMSGEKVPVQRYLVDPLKVVSRQSTDISAIDDQDIALAVNFIRRHACDGINVETVLKQVPLSRRALEHRFGKIFGRTPKAMIREEQIRVAKQLLVESELSVEQISYRVGYHQPAYLCSVFKTEVGLTPSQFRRKNL